MSQNEAISKKWAYILELPEEQVIPCLTDYVCLRYHGKSFASKMERTKEISLLSYLKIAFALTLWGRAVKKDTWGETYRATKFAEAWKTGHPPQRPIIEREDHT